MKGKRRRRLSNTAIDRRENKATLQIKESAIPHRLVQKPWYANLIGALTICLCTVFIYWQTISIPAIDYEDPFYLVHSPYVRVSEPFSRLGAVWNEPFFANFHPVTTTTWLIDRAFANKEKPFDALPFRISQLGYAILGAYLLIAFYRRLGIRPALALLGAVVFAIHPIHTEVIAWLSARKDLVSLIFIILSFLAWLDAREAATVNEWRIRFGICIVLALLAVLSKPIGVVTPCLLVAYEFCSASHGGISSWRWKDRRHQPVLTRTIMLAGLFIVAGLGSASMFRSLLERNPMRGGWLIGVLLCCLFLMYLVAPSKARFESVHNENGPSFRVLVPPFSILSLVCGAGSAWTLWAQNQVGAIKGGLTLLPTLNLTFDALLAYVGKVLVPVRMSASYSWSSYPNVSVKGVVGAILVCAAIGAAIRLAGSIDRNRRLIAFGIFWFFIALAPVLNIVPTSTKMADRYLFVPSIGAILVVLSAIHAYLASPQSRRWASLALFLLVPSYAAWSYARTEVWCGKTTAWNRHPQPDLSLWSSAVQVDPKDTFALTSLGMAYLRLEPPEPDEALINLNRALQLSESEQHRIAGDRHLILTSLYDVLGDAYLVKAHQMISSVVGTDSWTTKKEALANSSKYFELASQNPSGFASADARTYARLSEAYEDQAQLDAQELAVGVGAENYQSLVRERDVLRSRSETAIGNARLILASGNVPATDPNFQTVILTEGDILFNREVGTTSAEEKAGYYRQALSRYQDAAIILPDDPRPLLYQGLCYERLTEIAKSPTEKQKLFSSGQEVLHKALAFKTDSTGYSAALPLQALASLSAHMNDYQAALKYLKSARSTDSANPRLSTLDADIRTVEEYLANHPSRN